MSHRTRFVTVAALAVAALALAAGQASAQGSATATFNVSATVTRNCTISAANLSFGNYNVLSVTDLDAQNDLTVACTKNTTATIGLDLGQNPTGAVRQMAFGAERLPYSLYRDGARTLAWGPIGGADVYTYVAPNKNQATVTVYGRIPAGADVAAGGYADQIVATINF